MIIQALPDISAQTLLMYESMRPQWLAAAWSSARFLFWSLAVIEFAWAGAMLVVTSGSKQEWAAMVFRKVMTIGFFFALLIYGPEWMDAIIDSLKGIGQRGAGVSEMTPGDVFFRGGNIAGTMLAAASPKAYLTNPAAAFAMTIAALLVALAFALVAANYIMVLAESFIAVTAGMIFLGFGGSQWTRPYVERYIALAVAIGIKLMVLYLLIGTGMSLSNQWLDMAKRVGTPLAPPFQTHLAIMGAALIFLVLCWQMPKWFSGLISGAPALTGGDLIGSGVAVGGAGLATAYMASHAMTKAAGALTKAVSGMSGGGSSGGGSASAGGSSQRALPSGNGSTPRNVSPPNGGGSGGSGASQGGSSSSGSRRTKHMATGRATAIPTDHAHAPSPPRMPIDKDDD